MHTQPSPPQPPPQQGLALCYCSADIARCILAGRVPVNCTCNRPLLGFSKARLEATCADQGLEYIVDPSNLNTRHHRNAVRAALHHVYSFDQTAERNVQNLVGRLAEASLLSGVEVDAARAAAVTYLDSRRCGGAKPHSSRGAAICDGAGANKDGGGGSPATTVTGVGAEINLTLLFATASNSVQAALLSNLTQTFSSSARGGTRLKQVEQVLATLRLIVMQRLLLVEAEEKNLKNHPRKPILLMKSVCVGGCILRCTGLSSASTVTLSVTPQPPRKQSRLLRV